MAGFGGFMDHTKADACNLDDMVVALEDYVWQKL